MTPLQKEHQLTLEELFNKNQLMPRLRREFDEGLTAEHKEGILSTGLTMEFAIDLFAQMALRKRADVPTLVGLLRHHFNGMAQPTADALLVAAENNLVTWLDEEERFVLEVDVSDDVHAELESFQYPLPIVVKPAKLTHNRSSAYLTGSGSLILKDNHHEGDICLDHLNRMNAVKLTINRETASMVANSWRDMDKQKPDESFFDFNKRRRAFDKYDRSVGKVMEILDDAGNEFHLGHKYDKRGRTYCQGYHVNYQGNDWNKAIVEFANKEIIP